MKLLNWIRTNRRILNLSLKAEVWWNRRKGNSYSGWMEGRGHLGRKMKRREGKSFVKLNCCQLENWQNHLNHQGESEFAAKIWGTETNLVWPFCLHLVKIPRSFHNSLTTPGTELSGGDQQKLGTAFNKLQWCFSSNVTEKQQKRVKYVWFNSARVPDNWHIFIQGGEKTEFNHFFID